MTAGETTEVSQRPSTVATWHDEAWNSNDRRPRRSRAANARSPAATDPTWRMTAAPGERWVIVGLEWLALSSRSRRAAIDEARLAIAALLEVAPDAFDL